MKHSRRIPDSLLCKEIGEPKENLDDFPDDDEDDEDEEDDFLEEYEVDPSVISEEEA